MTPPRLVSSALALALACGLTPACRKEPAPPAPRPKATASAKPVDRLLPGELAPSKNLVFGFAIPRGMRVRGHFREVAYLEGEVAPEALANYVRDHVDVENVEIGAARTIFPSARIRNGAPDRIYQLEVVANSSKQSELVIRDVTPRPEPPKRPELTDEERWRAAGRRPDGKPFDLADPALR